MNTSTSKTSNDNFQESYDDLEDTSLPDTEKSLEPSQPERRIQELVFNKQGKLDKTLLTSSQLRMIKAFRSRPIVSDACREVKVSRDTHYRWLKENKIYFELIERAKDEGNDTAKSRLWDRVTRGDLNGIKYYLEHNDPAYAQNLNVVHSMSPSWYERQQGPTIQHAHIEVPGKDQHWLDKAIDRGDKETTNNILIKAAIKQNAGQSDGDSTDPELQTEVIPMGGTQ
jgi:hypothetical protein